MHTHTCACTHTLATTHTSNCVPTVTEKPSHSFRSMLLKQLHNKLHAGLQVKLLALIALEFLLPFASGQNVFCALSIQINSFTRHLNY